jgi:hypothetical protein
MATNNKCKCIDCKFNEKEVCMAKTINLDYAEDGSCKCFTYEPVKKATAPSEAPDQKAQILYG